MEHECKHWRWLASRFSNGSYQYRQQRCSEGMWICPRCRNIPIDRMRELSNNLEQEEQDLEIVNERQTG